MKISTIALGMTCSLGLLGAPGCKAGPEPRSDAPLLSEQAERGEPATASNGGAEPSAPAPPAPPPPPPPHTTPHPPGTILQSELFSILDTSPGVFLSHVDAEPRLVGGRFAGWVIRRFFADDARFVDSPLRPGDIVLRVNGSTLERPDQLGALWTRLRAAPALEVEINRAGVVTVWRWPIVADGTAPIR